MVGQAPLSAEQLLAQMNQASEIKKKNAMKIIGIGSIICFIGLVFSFIYQDLLGEEFSNQSIIMDSIEQLLCCGGPITVLVGVASLVAVGLDGKQYVSIQSIQDPPDGPYCPNLTIQGGSNPPSSVCCVDRYAVVVSLHATLFPRTSIEFDLQL